VAHFVEIQVGIATVSTRLYFAAFAGLAVAIGVGLTDDEEARATRSAEATSDMLDGSGLLHGAIVGLILIVLTYEFSVPSLQPDAPSFVVLWLLLGTWVGGLILLLPNPSTVDRTGRYHRANLLGYAIVSIAPWLLFTAIHIQWLEWRPVAGESAAERLRDIAVHVANTVSILYVVVFFVIGLTALLGLQRARLATGNPNRRPAWLCVPYVALLLGAVAAIIVTNLDGARADSFAKLGSSFEGDGRLGDARALYEEAQQLQPSEETYAISLGRVLMELARATPSDKAAERTVYVTQALAAVQRAQDDNPLNPLHARNLARVHRLWANLAVDPAEQARHFDQCEAYYAEATDNSPRNDALWREWATLYLEWHQPVKALGKLDAALRIAHDADTYNLRANAYLAVESFPDALVDYDRALAINPNSAEAWSGRGFALARLQRLSEAIEATRAAAALMPDDPTSRRNLALLYQQTGQLDLAISAAYDALAVAKPPEEPELRNLIEELKQSSVALRHNEE